MQESHPDTPTGHGNSNWELNRGVLIARGIDDIVRRVCEQRRAECSPASAAPDDDLPAIHRSSR